MADPNIIAVKNYLNSYYKNNDFWKPIEVDYTGVVLLTAIIRAFQISCGSTAPTGNIGPFTISKMKEMEPISLMDPDDEPNPFVCLVQCALFAKGYNAGGITGIYYNTGAAAVAKLQEDAGLPVTKVIDWKVWSALLSFNWFTTTYGGDDKLRTIQQQLNADWSDKFGVQACDGIMSRNTALSLLGALQAALGVNTDYVYDMNELNFGPATRAAFENNIGHLMSGYNDAARVPLNKLAQYGLYFNGFDAYNFDGNFDYLTKVAVSNFQKRHALLNLGLDEEGVIGITTLMSLITSKGNTDRPSRGCDTSYILNRQQAQDLKNAGYQVVGRYLTGTVGVGSEERDKALNLNEIEILKETGLAVFPIYQDGGRNADYFGAMQGYYDAVEAIYAAQRLGFTSGTTIYFALDFDCTEAEANNAIVPYFGAISNAFALTGLNKYSYKVGIYASRQVCQIVADKGYTQNSFVADMSNLYVGNLGHPIPENWAFDQFFEMCERDGNPFPSSPSFDADKVAVSGRDEGCRTFDEREEMTEAEKLLEARKTFSRQFMKSLNILNKYIGVEVSFDGKPIAIGTYTSGGCVINMAYSASTQFEKPSKNDFSFDIAFDSNGNFSEKTLSKIGEIVDQCDAASKGDVEKFLKNISVSAKCGSVKVSMNVTGKLTFRIKVTAQAEDLYDIYGVHGSVSNSIIMDVSIADNYEYQGIKIKELDLAAISAAALSTIAAICFSFLESIAAWINDNPEATALAAITVFLGFALSYGWIAI